MHFIFESTGVLLMFNWLKKKKAKSHQTSLPASQVNPSKVDHSSLCAFNTNAQNMSKKHVQQGNEWLAQEKFDEALSHYMQAFAISPTNPSICINIGYTLKEIKRYSQAKEYLEKALVLNAQIYDALYLLGEIALLNGESVAAIDYMKQAITVNPDFTEAMVFIATLYRDQGLAEQAVEYYRKAIASNVEMSAVNYSRLLLCLQYGGVSLSREEIREEHFNFRKKFEQSLVHLQLGHHNSRVAGRPLKIGYLSGDFKQHSVALFILPIIENHDRENFQIYCYYNNSTQDAMTIEIAEQANFFIPCAHLSDSQLAARIRADGIDILVDLSGHTDNNRLMVFARKPAPIQVTYLGYVDTTGLSTIDYRLTNDDADPLGNDVFYSEKLYRFEKTLWWCYRPAQGLPPIPPLPALKNGFLTFISVNDFLKISSLNMQMWSEILKELPNARLMLMGVPEGAQSLLREKFTMRGIDESRIALYARVPLDEYRSLLLQADIALDSSPFNGGTTTCETLHLGLPLITLRGEAFISRMGYAILKSLNLEEWVASTPQHYVQIAVALSKNIDRLAELRQEMRQRVQQSSISQEVEFTKEIEKAYRVMWQQYITT